MFSSTNAPQTPWNPSPHVPNFGEDGENLKRRIQIFQTKALPTTLQGIDRWIYDHAMDCIAWIAHEINENREYIDPQELWYKSTEHTPLTISANEGDNLFSEEQIRRICDANLLDQPNEDVQDSVPTIHQNFAAEFRCRRLARKRRVAQSQLRSDEEFTDEQTQRSLPFDHGRTAQSERLRHQRTRLQTFMNLAVMSITTFPRASIHPKRWGGQAPNFERFGGMPPEFFFKLIH